MSTLIISISAMCCPAEGGPVEQVLRAAPGVADVTLDYSTRTARVTGNRISGEALLEALLSIGMPGELVVTGARRIVLSVPEMDCPVEAGEIQKAFAAAGITSADFNVITRGRRRSRGRRSARRRILRLHGKGRSLGPQDDRKRADSLGALHQRPLRRLHVRGGRACE